MGGVVSPGVRRLCAAAMVVLAVAGCGPAAASPAEAPVGATSSESTPARTAEADSVVLVGRIVTMDEPRVAEAVFIEDGTVAAVGTRDEVLALAGDAVPVIDIGQNVAYPGFIDAHAHWIGDRESYHVDTAQGAIDAAIRRGWTSISEQWVNPERLTELTALAADDALQLRVDAYLALNFGTDFYGDWYTSRKPGGADDHLRVQGLKIHLDDGWGARLLWDPGKLTAAIDRANAAGWQVSVHAISAAAQGLALDAFEAAIGPDGPNPLHHRIEHAVQVTDEQLARLVAMDVPVVIQLDGTADWLADDEFLPQFDRDDLGASMGSITRWREFVDAGLHVAAATDAPWTFPGFELTEDMGRPVDQIAAGMDGQPRTVAETPPWLENQFLTADQGLRAVTVDAAYALGDEARRGHLAPGTLGDVTILSGDVRGATPDEIRDMEVIATIVGGVVVFCSHAEACGGR